MRVKTRRKKIAIFMIVIVIGFFTWQNNSITVNEIVVKQDKIPEAFNGYKIVHISDLHNKEFGAEQSHLLPKIKEIEPDIIVVTGDLIDSKNTNIDIAIDLIKRASEIAPIYYVSGNHEAWSGSYNSLKSRLEETGVTVLDDSKVEVSKGNSSIELIGLSDIAFVKLDHSKNDVAGYTENLLSNLTGTNSNFKIMLSHRPELFDVYANSEVDLVFSGHAHGGQFRLPFIGGLVAPNQGFFPKFTEGIHTNNHTSMVVSRGLGNSIIPVRIFNRPELVVVTLSKS
jgi:uncharacterized protein